MLSRASRTILRNQAPLRHITQAAPRRAISTVPPPQRSRSWKSSLARWGIAIGGVYWYNTSTAFAEAPSASMRLPETEQENEQLPTIDEVAAKRRKDREVARSRRTSSTTPTSSPSTEALPTSGGLQISPSSSTSSSPLLAESAEPSLEPSAETAVGSPDDLEEEAESQGAFNEETGEINWDCPCLGGMAHGPCGPEFREAFSCFVYSKEEPKGVDCIEKFKGMQECFRKHPEIYGAELGDDEDDDDEQQEQAGEPQTQTSIIPEAATSSELPSTSSPKASTGEKLAHTRPEDPTDEKKASKETKRAKAATKQVKEDFPESTSESEAMVPKAAFSAVEQPADHQKK